MINVCIECIRLNPLDREKCNYCGGKCEKVGNERLKTFMIEFNQRKQDKEKRETMPSSAKASACAEALADKSEGKPSTTLGAGQGGQKCR
ncbi:MAG: hypothetical protein A2Y82_00210 [Candidatus Buchananbacteria bacterium RBG_13_36_9]|uniref:Uncharacterized protein n=1 Tax=Candidatus Buchananbacteria bacterium RBG_13_36_9 TaxID=1797530 RepID=A0A1G1XP52_9BACT|nr:MAG: hypothetical protein A2Y82_00210 [Candidatus Buchananbacteria bacterium RBG_13_36_9]